MSKYTHISSATTTTLAEKSDYSINNATNRRGNDIVKINKNYLNLNIKITISKIKYF